MLLRPVLAHFLKRVVRNFANLTEMYNFTLISTIAECPIPALEFFAAFRRVINEVITLLHIRYLKY